MNITDKASYVCRYYKSLTVPHPEHGVIHAVRSGGKDETETCSFNGA